MTEGDQYQRLVNGTIIRSLNSDQTVKKPLYIPHLFTPIQKATLFHNNDNINITNRWWTLVATRLLGNKVKYVYEKCRYLT